MNAVHLHLLLNHVPVIGVPIGIALLAWAIGARERGQQRMALALLVVAGLATGLVYLTGDPAEDGVERLAGVSRAMIERHDDFATATVVAAHLLWIMGVITLFLSRQGRPLKRGLVVATLAVGLITSSMLAGTAWLGGQIRHDEIRSGAVAAPRDTE